MKKAPQKILAGIGIATLLGSAGIGFLIYQNNTALTQARASFDETAQSYKGLRTQPLFPNAENLKKLEEQRDAAASAADAALKELTPISFPLEAISPEQFQEKLRQSVDAVTAKAAERNVTLPNGFYLGFENYRTQAPSPAAAPALWRQMRAIELVVNILLDSRIETLTALERSQLPEEAGKPASTALVARYPFTVGFRSVQSAFRRTLNEITTSKQQFFIPRNVSVVSENNKQLPKVLPTAQTATAGEQTEGTAEAAEAAPAVQTLQSDGRALQYLVGLEKIDVTLNLEMVVFADKFSK